MKQNTRIHKLWGFILAFIIVVGGIHGLLSILYSMSNFGNINGPILLIFLGGISLFIFNIYTGFLVFYGEFTLKIFMLIFFNELIQIFQWKIYGYGLQYSIGPEILIGVQTSNFIASLNIILSRYAMSINSGRDVMFIVNLFPVMVLIYYSFRYYSYQKAIIKR